MDASRYYISWQPDYSVDVKEIDSQHKELLNLVNNALNHCTGNAEEEQKYFDRVMIVGIQSLASHYSAEERIMTETGYEHYLEHKAEHDKMLATLNQLTADIKSGKTVLDLLKITLFLRDWILDHIPKHDKKAATCFRQGNWK